MVTMFINTLPSPFYDKVVGSVASNLVDLVTIGERIESGIKKGKFAQVNIGVNFPKKTRYEKKKGETNANLIGKSSSTPQIILNKPGASTFTNSSAQPKVDTTNSSNALSNQPSMRS
ncbi:hypothetical protein CR513_20382, partial [Mucuna pruriens]